MFKVTKGEDVSSQGTKQEKYIGSKRRKRVGDQDILGLRENCPSMKS